MAAASTLTEVSLPPKEPSSGGGSSNFSSSRLFSKIGRSPTSSRRHKPTTSQGSGSDTAPDPRPPITTPPIQTQGAQHSKRNQPRPGAQRQISSPDPSALLQLKELPNEAKHHSDATGDTTQQARVLLAKQPSNPPPQLIGTPVSAKAPVLGNMSLAPLTSEYYFPQQIASNGISVAVNYMYQQLHELSQKRIATLQYMRKAYEGKLYWFNTVQFSKKDIEKFPSHMPNRLSRRAINYFLLGISLPAVLDVHQMPHPNSTPQLSATLAMEYMKSLNTLLTEFDNYQEKHPVEGNHAGSLSRARLPSMFKRSGPIGRPRKSSTAPSLEIGAQISPPAVPDGPHHQMHHAGHPSIDTTASTTVTASSSATTLVNSQSMGIGRSVNSFSATATFPPPGPADAPNSSLLPNEAPYTHLLTPPLPFAPDFYVVFATLCDVLIDTYQRLLQMVNGPHVCSAAVADLFSKTDAKVRKVIVGGIVRDFEAASRENAKRELAGVQKVVLGGLMG